MQELTFVALSSDGDTLMMVAPDGSEFCLPADDKIRKALGVKPARESAKAENMQMRIPIDGPLTPREIQHRLRHGSPMNELEAESGISTERLEAYAAPVMAERFYVADLAKASPVPAGGTLEEAVLHRLQARGVTDEPEWDSWRRPDGSWLVVARFASDLSSVPQSEEIATWVFDPKRRATTPDDDTARWLTDAAGAEPGVAVSAEINPNWDQAHPATRAAKARAEAAAAESETPAGESGTAEQPQDRPATGRSNPAPNGPTGRPLSRRALRRQNAKRRNSSNDQVPTWDEILFGSGRSEQPPGGTPPPK